MTSLISLVLMHIDFDWYNSEFRAVVERHRPEGAKMEVERARNDSLTAVFRIFNPICRT